VIQKLWEVTGGDAIITSDVGQHQMWAAQYYGFDKPRRWLNSGGLGTMGVGMPYAMGAKLANPDVPVACVTGEASIQMNIQELSTCKQFRLPIKICNLNNRYLGMVRPGWPRPTVTSASASTVPPTSRARCGRRSQPTGTSSCSSTSRSTRPRTSIRWCRAGRVSPR